MFWDLPASGIIYFFNFFFVHSFPHEHWHVRLVFLDKLNLSFPVYIKMCRKCFPTLENISKRFCFPRPHSKIYPPGGSLSSSTLKHKAGGFLFKLIKLLTLKTVFKKLNFPLKCEASFFHNFKKFLKRFSLFKVKQEAGFLWLNHPGDNSNTISDPSTRGTKFWKAQFFSSALKLKTLVFVFENPDFPPWRPFSEISDIFVDIR